MPNGGIADRRHLRVELRRRRTRHLQDGSAQRRIAAGPQPHHQDDPHPTHRRPRHTADRRRRLRCLHDQQRSRRNHQVVWPGPLAVGGSATVEYVGAPNGTDLRNTITSPPTRTATAPSSEAPTDSVRIVIPDPVVGITKTYSHRQLEHARTSGHLVPFRIRVTNTGSMTAHNLTVTDTVPANTCATTNGHAMRRGRSRRPCAVQWTIPGNSCLEPRSRSISTSRSVGRSRSARKTNTATVQLGRPRRQPNAAGVVYTASNVGRRSRAGAGTAIVKSPEIEDGATVQSTRHRATPTTSSVSGRSCHEHRHGRGRES